MHKRLINRLVCPKSHLPLALKHNTQNNGIKGDEINVGMLHTENGFQYAIRDGLAEFILPNQLAEIEQETQKEYNKLAEQNYNNAIDWLFQSFYEDEDKVREQMIDLLEIQSNHRILEVGCGTGRDSFRIAKRLNKEGQLYLQDLSRNMVLQTEKRLTSDAGKLGLSCELNYFVSNATHLPFPDNYFDSVFSFGGFNHFGDKKETFKEFSRIVKKGGKVVCGDESLPPWLKDTRFGEIIITNNALFRHEVPLSSLPENARNVIIRWILGECFYLIEYKVGEGTPPINLDLPHKGWRGGTMKSRYYGQLEGVTLQAKALAKKAAAKKGVSLHQWLDQLIIENSKKDLGL